jgi:hypothetical protein
MGDQHKRIAPARHPKKMLYRRNNQAAKGGGQAFYFSDQSIFKSFVLMNRSHGQLLAYGN